MTVEEHIKAVMGDLAFQLCATRAEAERLKVENDKLTADAANVAAKPTDEATPNRKR